MRRPASPTRVLLLAAFLAPAGCDLMENWEDYEYLSAANGWSGSTSYDDSDADVFFDVAATSLAVSRDPEENRATMEETLLDVAEAEPDLDIVLFGETITGWYRASDDDDENAAYQASVAEPVPGPTSELP